MATKKETTFQDLVHTFISTPVTPSKSNLIEHVRITHLNSLSNPQDKSIPMSDEGVFRETKNRSKQTI
jgi:hypothetical protein